MWSRAAVLAVCGAAAVACATIPASAPPYSRAPDPGAGMANVYIYRTGLQGNCQKIGAPALFVDGHAIYNLVDGAYTVVPLPSGTHKLRVWASGACPDLEFYLDVGAGQSQYVRFSGSYGSESVPYARGGLPGAAWVARARADQVAEPAAERELAECCRFLPAEKLPANISPRDRLITGR
jgi:hypothetical protein